MEFPAALFHFLTESPLNHSRSANGSFSLPQRGDDATLGFPSSADKLALLLFTNRKDAAELRSLENTSSFGAHESARGGMSDGIPPGLKPASTDQLGHVTAGIGPFLAEV